jgi:uncharacterized OsmC-like protein
MGTVATTRNGVNLEALQATVAAITKDPALGKFTFRSTSKWISGAHSHSTFDSLYGAGQEHKRSTPHFLEGDEPAALLGTDLGPNAAEAALHALTSCMSVTYAYNAAAMGIEIQSLSFELETDTNLVGFLELDPKVRPGLTHMRVKVNLACSGTPEQVKELHAKVQRTSPLLDTFKNPVDVKIKTH